MKNKDVADTFNKYLSTLIWITSSWSLGKSNQWFGLKWLTSRLFGYHLCKYEIYKHASGQTKVTNS